MKKPPKPTAAEISKAANIMGRLGGLAAAGKGGRARFAKMTKAEKSAFGRAAIRARWAKVKTKKQGVRDGRK